MTDWARFLPLSNRDRGDESHVSRNWSRAASGMLLSVAAVLDARPEVLAHPTLRPEVSVAEAVRELLVQLRSTRWQRAAARIGAVESASPETAALPDAELADAVQAEALARSAARARSSVRELGAVLVLALDLRASIGASIDVDPFVSGAVALDLAVRAPHPRRSVVTARTLVAVDGDWRVGRGPELPATAASIVLFLAGRGGVPPHALPEAGADDA
ncbi:MAG: hypothetical protein KIT89_02185 [Microcella sp.]|uniref:hypothetical protein n=1 Tax=Microcella sp. TaxID=1913979 RepID=UPI0024C80B38|nr:hypothetical protein [Microcella sp.]UYN84059.1 MAG: hypothetical protein KIT89_02185 [Microcella sp.]